MDCKWYHKFEGIFKFGAIIQQFAKVKSHSSINDLLVKYESQEVKKLNFLFIYKGSGHCLRWERKIEKERHAPVVLIAILLEMMVGDDDGEIIWSCSSRFIKMNHPLGFVLFYSSSFFLFSFFSSFSFLRFAILPHSIKK